MESDGGDDDDGVVACKRMQDDFSGQAARVVSADLIGQRGPTCNCGEPLDVQGLTCMRARLYEQLGHQVDGRHGITAMDKVHDVLTCGLYG
jgi:hypothetical protein